jgi:hypothetical protein
MLDFHKQLVILSFKLNFSDDETKPLRYRVLFSIDTVIADFKSTFMGYQAMAPSVQERLLNRLIKIYSQAEEKNIMIIIKKEAIASLFFNLDL